MKKLILSLVVAICATSFSFAQAPEAFKYQAVARDNTGSILANQSVSFQISILQGSTNGSSVYTETHATTTNGFGLVNLEIGNGTLVSGNFANIDWGANSYFVQIEMDETGGSSYSLMGTSQLMSVPYALHAKNTDSWKIDSDTTYTTKNVGIGTSNASNQLTISKNSTQSPILVNSTNSPVIYLGSNGGFTVKDTVTDFTVNAAMQVTPSALQVNGEPTFTFFTPTGQGPNRHYNFRINGSNRLTISGTGVVNINSVLKLTPRPSAPLSPSKGDIYMDDNANKLMVYDGTTWQACW